MIRLQRSPQREKAGRLTRLFLSPNPGDSYFMNQSDKRNDKPNEAPYKRRLIRLVAKVSLLSSAICSMQLARREDVVECRAVRSLGVGYMQEYRTA